jgi:predicted FMN-binding regulatory protein PaiB
MYGHPKTPLSHDEIVHTLAKFRRRATLITSGAGGLKATELSLLYTPPRDSRDRKDLGRLVGRLALANDQWKDAEAGAIEALVLLPSPATPDSHWHFETVHAYGQMKLFRDEGSLRSILASLSDNPEAQGWKPEHAPVIEIERQLPGIIGVTIDLERATAKRRLKEERPAEDRANAMAALQAADEALEHELTSLRH